MTPRGYSLADLRRLDGYDQRGHLIDPCHRPDCPHPRTVHRYVEGQGYVGCCQWANRDGCEEYVA